MTAHEAPRRRRADQPSTYLRILRELVPALTAIGAVILFGGAVGVPLAVVVGTLEGNAADVAGSTALGMGAGAVAVFLLAARWSAGAIREAEDRAGALADRKRYADARLREIRMIADELHGKLETPSGPGDLLGLSVDEDPWSRDTAGHRIALRTIGHLAHDAIAGHVVFTEDEPRDAHRREEGHRATR